MADLPGTSDARRDRGPSAKHWGILVAVVLAVVFIALNSQEVQIDFLIGEANAPLVFALLISTLLGLVIGYLTARMRRRD